MENNKNKKSVKCQGDMLNFCDFIQVFVFTPNHHLKKNILPLYRHFSDLSPFAGFLSLVRVTHFSQFEKGILCPLS